MYGALPSTPISEIRTRKWTKETKTVGHLSIPKWVPDQEVRPPFSSYNLVNPTEALQKGASKKLKGRKRGAGEGGRMTRSVRQHLDAPLELLSEYPVRVHPPRASSSPAETVPFASSEISEVASSFSDMVPTDGASYLEPQAKAACAVSVAVQGPAEVKHTETALIVKETARSMQPLANIVEKASTAASATNASSDSTMPVMPVMPPVSNQLITDVPSDEQLEMVLDDLPMLDADDSFDLDALDPAFLPAPVPSVLSATNVLHSGGISSKQQSTENSSASISEEDASVNSGSSMPSYSPQSSPRVMSRSSSP
uniref:Uncharacterized protein n=1 Tax=Hyaloperonospora arabidopsidis (strain Emoy2) TaxID=559515 RepID=M4C411_HYAAE